MCSIQYAGETGQKIIGRFCQDITCIKNSDNLLNNLLKRACKNALNKVETFENLIKMEELRVGH